MSELLAANPSEILFVFCDDKTFNFIKLHRRIEEWKAGLLYLIQLVLETRKKIVLRVNFPFHFKIPNECEKIAEIINYLNLQLITKSWVTILF